MKNREEDIELNLTGDEANQSDAADKSRWFKRIRKGINTSTADKKETPEGLWSKCPSCNHICTSAELKEHLYICSIAIFITELVAMNISISYLMNNNLKCFLIILKVKTP